MITNIVSENLMMNNFNLIYKKLSDWFIDNKNIDHNYI